MGGPEARPGSLTIVGSGIRPGLHTTHEARARIEGAGKVLYLLAERAPAEWILRLNPSAESLAPLYQAGRDHGEVYQALVNTMLTWVRRGEDVCVVTYGNPAVFDQSSHEAVRLARAEGFPAKILPGISALDCLFVDLGLDPGEEGLQSFDATDFLVLRKTPDPTVPLILWQISVIGDTRTGGTVNREGVRILAERLAELYGRDHEVIVYEVSPFPVGRALIESCSLKGLHEAGVTGLSTLYVPPASKASPDPAMVALLAASDVSGSEQTGD
jgi:tetrapyrrole (corrin/porphyrin) methylase-like protein